MQTAPTPRHTAPEHQPQTPEPVARAIEIGLIIALLAAFTIVAIAADFKAISHRVSDALFYVERV